MLSVRACPSLLLVAALLVSPAFATRTHRASTSAHHHHRIFRRSRHHVVKGQRGIDPDRAREIQTALIRQHYLSGAPSGQWDAATESAMQKFQADHGWQTKLTPDSRALIMLGLGPNAAPQSTPAASTATAPVSPAPAPAGNTLASTHVIQN
ncbi:MAG TPA: peptidoglycan-binding domain-containing protein [Silvibacterium sp.]|nr:peptidoglycan-binding domain-containing protein [Silvibacterium sp.]